MKLALRALGNLALALAVTLPVAFPLAVLWLMSL
jgi:hypothetical protein